MAGERPRSDHPDSGIPDWIAAVLHRHVPFWEGQVIAATCTAVAGLVRYLVDELVVGVPFITFFPGVAAASAWGGARAGISATLLAALVTAYRWLPPTSSLDLTSSSVISLALFLAMAGLVVLMVHMLQSLVRAVKRAEDRAELMAREMKHRVSNVIALIQSISATTARTARDVEDYRALFQARLLALAGAQDLAAPDPKLPTDLEELLSRVLTPFDLSRFSLSGPPVGIYDGNGSTLALVIHELGTNGVKYGALSVPGGHVSVSWEPAGEGICLDWKEIGAPPVAPPSRTGLGMRLLKSAFPPSYGEATISFEPDGVRCRFFFPGRVERAGAS